MKVYELEYSAYLDSMRFLVVANSKEQAIQLCVDQANTTIPDCFNKVKLKYLRQHSSYIVRREVTKPEVLFTQELYERD